MQIIYFVQYFIPEKAAGLPLVEDLLDGYVKSGFDVKVFTPTPTRGISKEERNILKKKKIERKYDGKLVIHRMALYREKTGFVSRALRYFIFSLECLWKGFTEPGEIVFTGSGPPTQGVIVGIVRKFTKKKFIYNLQDIFPDSLVNAGITHEGSIVWKLGRKMERFSYKQADKIIVISEDFKNNLLAKGVPSEKIEVIPNWVNTNNVYPIPRKDNSLIKKYSLNPDKFYICYSGNIGYTQNIELLIEVAEEIKENIPDIAFIIIGEGAAKNKLNDYIEEKKLTNIILLPYQPYEKLAEVFSIGDVGLVISKTGIGENSIPSKTWDIMAAGRPVLASFDEKSELNKIVNQVNCGIAVDAGNKEDLIKAIYALYNNHKLQEIYGANGLKYVKTYLDKNNCVDRYIKVTKEVICTN